MKTAKDYLDEANAVVKKIDTGEAIEKHKSSSAIFIDVEIALTSQKLAQ